MTPPPAIAQSLAQNSRDHLQKFGHVTNQLRKSVKMLKSIEESYSTLYKSPFDADPCTLEHLEIAKHITSLFAYSVEIICLMSPSDIPNLPFQMKYPETKYALNICTKIMKEFANLPNETGAMKSITTQHTDIIIKQIEILTKSPICMPRFFFQTLQNTSIKLSISPQPRVTGEPTIIQNGCNLVVKVEGVVQHYGRRPNLFRTVDMVQLTLVSQSVITTRVTEIKPVNDTITLTQNVKHIVIFCPEVFYYRWEIKLVVILIQKVDNGL